MSKFKNLAIVIFVLAIFCCLLFEWSTRTRKVEGIWLAQFEALTFHEDATPADLGDLDELGGSWINLDPRIYLRTPHKDKAHDCHPIHAFKLSFVGRKSFGLAGHLSGWRSSFEVDRVISIEPLAYPICGKDHQIYHSAG